MRWLTFLILAVLTVSLQAAVGGRFEVLGARPDWVLVLVVFYALHARTDNAMVAGWVAGALADLMTVERFGLLAVCYGLTAVAVCRGRAWVFTVHALTQFNVTLACAAALQGVWTIYRVELGMPAGPLWPMLGSCLYTALWAPPAHWLLLKASRLLRIGDQRYSYARLPRVGKSRV